jgi:hypothetical protein
VVVVCQRVKRSGEERGIGNEKGPDGCTAKRMKPVRSRRRVFETKREKKRMEVSRQEERDNERLDASLLVPARGI